ncbi:1588_t:CDS:2, partial [Scutellospora calospora]
FIQFLIKLSDKESLKLILTPENTIYWYEQDARDTWISKIANKLVEQVVKEKITSQIKVTNTLTPTSKNKILPSATISTKYTASKSTDSAILNENGLKNGASVDEGYKEKVGELKELKVQLAKRNEIDESVKPQDNILDNLKKAHEEETLKIQKEKDEAILSKESDIEALKKEKEGEIEALKKEKA